MYRMTALLSLTTALACLSFGTGPAHAGDWPQWGRTNDKNMVAPDAGNLPITFDPGKEDEKTGFIKPGTTKNVLWVAKMGSQTYGNPTISNGRVYVGTNNDSRKDPRFKGDYSLLKCLDEKTGKTLWTLTVPKLGTGKVSDWESLGICSSPAVDGDRVYIVTNRCEVLCLDAKGLADGNDGPFKQEAQYMANGLDEDKPKPPVAVKPTDADILWRYDMRLDLGIFPHNITSSSILVVDNLLYVATSNGVDWSHTNIPNPRAPSLIAVNKTTGAYAGSEFTDMGFNILHGGWSSPAHGTVNGKDLVFFGGPDGYLYGFKAEPQTVEGEPALKEVFKVDGNPKHYRFKKDEKTGKFVKDSDGKLVPIKYVKRYGPSEFIATPVFYKNRIYIPIGQDPEHGPGAGRLICVDATKTGNLSDQVVNENKTKITDNPDHGLVWTFDKIHRSISAETGCPAARSRAAQRSRVSAFP